MIQQAEFLSTYNLNSADLKATNLNYEELLNISADFESKKAAYDEIGTGVVKILFKFDAVHAIKYQVQNSEELIANLVAYKLQHPEAILDLTTYEALIENLINIRIIPLFKSDWAKIHDSIVDQFVVIGNMTANVRAEDAATTTKAFTDKGCTLKTQSDGYRSVDYVIKTAPSKKEYKVAVQVRNIFEEGWAEIDHSARYKNKMDSQILNEFSKTLNKLAGGADEMGEFIHGLQSYLEAQETLVQQQQTLVEEQQVELENLRAELAKTKLTEKTSNSSEGMLGKDIIEDLAKTAAAIDGGSVPTETPISAIKTTPEPAAEKVSEKVPVKTEEKLIDSTPAAETEKTTEEKPKTVKNRTDKPKALKLKEEKITEEKPKVEMLPVVEDLFGQTRIPDAPPLKPSITNA